MNQTDNDLLDVLVTASCEDITFLENRLIELIELDRDRLVAAYLEDG
jgi:hypothetical protein